MIPVLGSQPAGNVSHKPGVRLPLLSARPAVTPATIKRAATTVLLLCEQKHDGCEQFAQDCFPTASRLRFEPGPFCARVQHANHSATERREQRNVRMRERQRLAPIENNEKSAILSKKSFFGVW